MSIPHQYPYTSVLGDIQVPLNTKPLTSERKLQLQYFFDSYIEPNLTATEREMVYRDGYSWLVLANPCSFNQKVIKLHTISTDTTQYSEPYTYMTDGCLQHTEGAVLSCRHMEENTIIYLPRKKWGLYLFKFVADN